jgi:hypothetical protein
MKRGTSFLNVARIGAMSAMIAAGFMIAATGVRAEVFDFTITSANGDASGQFTASGGPSQYTVTAATGTVDGSTITGLSGYGDADNQLFEPSPYVDRSGISFVAGGLDYNIFTNYVSQSGAVYGLCVSSVEPSCTGGEANNAPVATLTLSPTSAAPEPSIWLMMSAGIGGIGLMMRQRKAGLGRGVTDVLAA